MNGFKLLIKCDFRFKIQILKFINIDNHLLHVLGLA